MKKSVLLLSLLAAGVAGLLTLQTRRAQPEMTAPSPPRPARTVSPADLSTPPPAIHIASPVASAPPPLLVEEPSIQGRVLDSRDEPVAGAAVSVYSNEHGAHKTFTNDAGRFAVGPLAPAEYRVSAAKAMYNEALLENARSGGEPLTLTLTDASRALGRVIDERGEPIEAFDYVYVPRFSGDEPLWTEIKRSEQTRWTSVQAVDGQFEANDVASGKEFGLGARAAGFAPAIAIAPKAAPGETVGPIEIRLIPEAKVAGAVMDPARNPIANATIHLGLDTEAPVAAESDSDGHFDLAGLGEEEIVLTAAHEQYLSGTARVTPVSGAAARVEIVLGEGGAIEGFLWNGGEPAAGQTVAALRLSPPRVHKQAVTDENGKYRIEGVGLGLVEVLAKYAAEGRSSPLRLQQRAEIAAGAVTRVDFHFPLVFAALEGTISADGQLIAFAEVQGTVTTPDGESSFNTTAGEDGFYQINALPPGMALVNVHARAADAEMRRGFTVELRGGETARQDVAFDTQSGISGEVGGLAAGDVGQVLAFTGEMTVDTSSLDALVALDASKVAEADIGENGEFEMKGLAPGEYTLVALVFSGEADTGQDAFDSIGVATQQVTAPESGQTRVTLTISP